MSSPIDEIEIYLDVKDSLESLSDYQDGWPTTLDSGPLCRLLDSLSGYPFVDIPSYQRRPSTGDKFTIAGQDAGSFAAPNVDLILQKSTVSAFGKGEEWITDLNYRNGREIEGTVIDLGAWYKSSEERLLQRKIVPAMFVGREISFKLHKLAVYTKGGHFDWHLDATHSEKHQATTLIALNTQWEGGDLILRRNGVETRHDMKPDIDVDSESVTLGTTTFFTDTEHKVEEVTSGTRIVLQFDVLVTENDDKKTSEDDVSLSELKCGMSERNEFESFVPDHADQASIDRIIEFLKTTLESGSTQIGFSLQHLHRKVSTRPKYLKGSDARLYQAFVDSGIFDVMVHPVVLAQRTDWDGTNEPPLTFIYNSDANPANESWAYEPPVDAASSEKKAMTHFYANKASALTLIYSQDYIEHRGNEPERGEDQYVGGGMFVRLKRKSEE